MKKIDLGPKKSYEELCALSEKISSIFPNTKEGTEEALKWLVDSKYISSIDDLEERAFINGFLFGELIKRQAPNAKWLKDFSGLEVSDTMEFYPQNKLYKYYTGEDTVEDVIGFYISNIEICKDNNLNKIAKALRKSN